mgnify:FL=1
MFADNVYYGHRYIFSKYCKTKNFNCFASIQHGIMSLPQERNLGKRRFIFAPFLTWNKRVENNAKKKNIPSVTAIGAPFIYLDKMIKRKIKVCKGTLVFPSKSTIDKSRSINNLELIKETERSFPGPYSICIYYLDLNKDWKIFKKKGWKLYTCGDKKSEKFLYKLHKLLTMHNNVICTSINTSAFYSMFMKKNFKLIMNQSDKKKVKQIVFQNKVDDKLQLETKNFYEKRYPGFIKNRLTKIQRFELAKNELGYSCIKSPKEIYNLLGWNNILKKILAKIFNFYFLFRIYKDGNITSN